MKNRVNLYHLEFHPKLRLLTLSIVIVSWVLMALLCVLSQMYMTAEQQNFKSVISRVEVNKQQQKTLVKELKKSVDDQKIDPILNKQVETNQRLLILKKRVLNELDGQEVLKSIGFSKLMIDLANNSQSGMWLTHINLNGTSVIIEGAATDSAAIPKWLSSLGQTDYFRGQNFSETRLYRDSEQQLNFFISTGKELLIDKGPNDE